MAEEQQPAAERHDERVERARPDKQERSDKKKNGSFLWPVALIVGILVIVVAVAILSEVRKPSSKPEVKPDVITSLVPRQPTPTPVPAPIPQQKVELLVCIAGDLYLHVPPLAPYKLYYRPSDRFVSVPCETRKVEVK